MSILGLIYFASDEGFYLSNLKVCDSSKVRCDKIFDKITLIVLPNIWEYKK